MELIERDVFLNTLGNHFQNVENGVGHAVFLTGEAGIGKTSLLNAFLRTTEARASNYIGSCDLLFTPRPLGPLFDVAELMDSDFAKLLHTEKDRAKIFGALFHHFSTKQKHFGNFYPCCHRLVWSLLF